MGLKITNLSISNYMTAYPISVESKIPLMKAINFMVERGFGNLIVSDGTIPKGILTEREILKAIADSKDIHKLTVLVFDEDKLVGIVTVTDLLRAFRKTKSDLSLDDVASTTVEKCKSSDSIYDVVKKLHEKRIGSIIVGDMKGYGIFTERDLLIHLASPTSNLHDSVGQHSSSPLIVANEGISVHEAASIMASKDIKRLGLVKDGLLVHVVTARDIVDAYQSVYSVTNPYLDDLSEYVSG